MLLGGVPDRASDPPRLQEWKPRVRPCGKLDKDEMQLHVSLRGIAARSEMAHHNSSPNQEPRLPRRARPASATPRTDRAAAAATSEPNCGLRVASNGSQPLTPASGPRAIVALVAKHGNRLGNERSQPCNLLRQPSAGRDPSRRLRRLPDPVRRQAAGGLGVAFAGGLEAGHHGVGRDEPRIMPTSRMRQASPAAFVAVGRA